MAFTSWTQILSDFKDALAARDIESFFQSSYENSRQMRVTYTKLGNIQDFISFLETKASEETSGASAGTIFTAVGGN